MVNLNFIKISYMYAFLLRQFFGNFWVLPIEEYCLWWIFGSGILNSDFRHCGQNWRFSAKWVLLGLKSKKAAPKKRQNWPFSVLKPSNLALFDPKPLTTLNFSGYGSFTMVECNGLNAIWTKFYFILSQFCLSYLRYFIVRVWLTWLYHYVPGTLNPVFLV